MSRGFQVMFTRGRVNIQNELTAIAIRTPEDKGNFIRALIAGDTINIPQDPDAPDYTYFLSLKSKQHTIDILLDAGTYEVFTINSGTSPVINEKYRKGSETECSNTFTSIPQSEWRTGLPAPNYTRSFTQVEHVVIHHSAGSNSNPDYTQVVRDIYLYHTNVNGWSDIGYNYLVAQDGSIYDGRDPAGGEQDNVLGAHFCGANSSTMGVCLLGNYETADLPQTSHQALEKILAFKLNKEGLTPYSTHQHSLGNFEAIIGHRDGCSTLCPGSNVYEMLGQLKTEVMIQLENNCDENEVAVLDFSVDRQLIKVGESINFLNESTGYTSYQWIFDGGSPASANWKTGGLVLYNVPGVFDVSLVGMSDDKQDTLRKENYVEIQGDPVVFPNPIHSLTSVNVQYHFDILSVDLITMMGSKLDIERVSEGVYQLPYVRPGVYILNILTNRKRFQQKIRVY